jgi:hypothetical protein
MRRVSSWRSRRASAQHRLGRTASEWLFNTPAGGPLRETNPRRAESAQRLAGSRRSPKYPARSRRSLPFRRWSWCQAHLKSDSSRLRAALAKTATHPQPTQRVQPRPRTRLRSGYAGPAWRECERRGTRRSCGLWGQTGDTAVSAWGCLQGGQQAGLEGLLDRPTSHAGTGFQLLLTDARGTRSPVFDCRRVT